MKNKNKGKNLLYTVIIMGIIVSILTVVGIYQYSLIIKKNNAIPEPQENVIYKTTYGSDIIKPVEEEHQKNTVDSEEFPKEKSKTIRIKYEVQEYQNDAIVAVEYINVNTPIIEASLFNGSGQICYTPDETLIKNPGTILFRVPDLYAGEWTAAIKIHEEDDIGKVLAYVLKESDYIASHAPSEIPHDNNYEWEIENNWNNEIEEIP